jgi:hypothetical protein
MSDPIAIDASIITIFRRMQIPRRAASVGECCSIQFAVWQAAAWLSAILESPFTLQQHQAGIYAAAARSMIYHFPRGGSSLAARTVFPPAALAR